MSDQEVKIPEGATLWDLKKLKPYDKNARTHSQEQVEQIAASMVEFGFTQPILIDAEGGIVAGHGRHAAANHLGLERVPVIVLNHLDERQRRAYVIADNQIALNAGWDEATLRRELEALTKDGFDLGLLGFSEDDLAKLMPEVEKCQPGGDDEAVPSLPAAPISKLGDLWTLGRHRLLVGDATSIDACEKLMAGKRATMVFTDPPYGVDFQSNRAKEGPRFDPIENDDTFLTEWIQLLPIVSTGWVFVWTTWKVLEKWFGITDAIGDMTNMVVWNKGGGGIGDLEKTFSTDYEIALVFNRGAKIKGKRLGSVWTVGKDGATTYVHPTHKPVALAEMALENCTEASEIVLDLFGGSGSTLIACEKLRRKCRMMELDPRYADVIVKRWQDYSGKMAVLESGESFAELATKRAGGKPKKKKKKK